MLVGISIKLVLMSKKIGHEINLKAQFTLSVGFDERPEIPTTKLLVSSPRTRTLNERYETLNIEIRTANYTKLQTHCKIILSINRTN